MSYRREDISNAIWDDEDFDALSLEAAFLYLWSFTNPRCGMAGVYRVKRRDICEGKLNREHPVSRTLLTVVLEELADSRHLFYTDGYMWVRTRVKHLRTKGKPMMTSIVKDVLALPQGHPFIEAFITENEPHWKALTDEIRRGTQGVPYDPPRGSQGVHSNGLDKPEVEETDPFGVIDDDFGSTSGFQGTPPEPPEGSHGSGSVRGKGSGFDGETEGS